MERSAYQVAYITEPGLHVLQLQQELKRAGAEVDHFPRTMPALDAILTEGGQYSLVVLDVHTSPGRSARFPDVGRLQRIRDAQMPYEHRFLTNLEAVQEFKRQRPQLSVVAIGLYDARRIFLGKRIAEHVRGSGADDYVKVSSIHALAQRVRQHLTDASQVAQPL